MEENVPTSAGLSSFNLLDEQKFFDALVLQQGMTLFDLGCGLGNYTVGASPRIGEKGLVIAMDPWHEGIETLAFRSQMSETNNIYPLVADAAQGIPLCKHSADCCLLATVVHILLLENKLGKVLQQLCNILRPTGSLAVVEFHKIKGPPGPPFEWRISPAALDGLISPYGYTREKTLDVGPYNYLTLFRNAG